ncbi:MAG TPA: hypothetical protein VK153_02155 [Candidatus Paceibacterota bacterium]|nr:hypothetical protein [Candidatus Paceibacterota bacterium]
MALEIIPTAEANIETLVRSVNRVIINPIIVLLFALAVVYFIYGILQYLFNPDNEEIRNSSKKHMLWGIIGMFVMVSVFGIMNIILNTIGEHRIQIDNNNINIQEMQ